MRSAVSLYDFLWREEVKIQFALKILFYSQGILKSVLSIHKFLSSLSLTLFFNHFLTVSLFLND